MMHATPLRKLVSAIGLTVAITTAVATPGMYFIHDYIDVTATMSFKAQLNAARIARYIYTHDDMWQYQQLRLGELIQLPESVKQQARQKIYDQANRLVFDDSAPVDTPIVARSAPIVVAGSTVGVFVVEGSLRETLYETWLVAFVSTIIGFGAYFALRIFPLRVLDRTLAVLHETQRDLAVQIRRLDAAVNNMSQGLVMFDSSARLVVCNKRYLEMFGLSPEKVKAGCAIKEVLDQRVATGGFSADGVEAYRTELLASVAKGTTFSKITKLPDGRIISIINQPMADGGWVATHEDITERLIAEEKIRHLAHYDALTDLPNRVTFYERMETVLSRQRRSESIAVLSLDLDRFQERQRYARTSGRRPVVAGGGRPHAQLRARRGPGGAAGR